MKPKEAERSIVCVKFTNACDVKWSELERTDDTKRRHCSRCSKSVFWCENAIEASLRVDQRECIAVPHWLAENAGSALITIGQGTTRDHFERIQREHLESQKNTDD